MIEINNTTKANIPEYLVLKVVRKFLKHYKITKSVSIAFVVDKKIKELNKIYRKKDKITDVLSFSGDDENLGEIIIDYGQIKRQAKEGEKTNDYELIFILVHGLLHLIGENDEAEIDRLKMIKKGEELIDKLCLI